MNSNELERRLDVWFDAVEPRHAPEGLFDGVFAVTRGASQRRGLLGQFATLVAERRMPPALEVSVGFRLLVVSLLILAALAATALVAASLIRFLPRPVEDGAIVVEEELAVPPDITGPARRLSLLLPSGDLVPLHGELRREVCASFSPDGTQIAYYSAPLDASEPPVENRDFDNGRDDFRLTVGSATPGGAWRILATDLTPHMYAPMPPSWSPRGDALVMETIIPNDDGIFIERYDLVVVPTDGSPPKSIFSFGPAVTESGVVAGYSPTWSPDGDWIAFRGRTAGGYAIAVVRPDGTGLRVLADWPLVSPTMIETLAWSPDSRWLAYNRHAPGTPPAEQAWDVHVVDVEGAGDRVVAVTTGRESVLEWSPDGTRLATLVGGRTGSLRLFDVETGAFSDVALDRLVRGATWAAAGDRLVAVTGSREVPGEVWDVPVSSGGAARLLGRTAASSCEGQARWQDVGP